MDKTYNFRKFKTITYYGTEDDICIFEESTKNQ